MSGWNPLEVCDGRVRELRRWGFGMRVARRVEEGCEVPFRGDDARTDGVLGLWLEVASCEEGRKSC